jgi:Flp pilus assembly protein TadD
VVTVRSERKVEDAFQAAIDGRPIAEVEDLFQSSRPLNPGAAREVTMARANFESGRRARAEELMRRAAELEPSSARVWYFRTRLDLALGRRADAQRHWALARELDPQLPRALPPPL